jgi:hypothetical protein
MRLVQNEGGKKKREYKRVLNMLLFVGCHITDKHNWATPCVPWPPMFVGVNEFK